MKKFCKGVAHGFISTAKGTRGKVAKRGGLGGISVGLRGLKPKRLSESIRRKCKTAFGSEGAELKTFTIGISMAIIEEMTKASIKGTDAGTAKNFGKWSTAKMAKAMFSKTGFKPTEYNKKFFKAICDAITEEIRKYGQSSIPSVGTGAGPKIATIS
jgi:hypothetical protein